MDTLDTKNEQNEPDIFVCEKCDYKCFKKSNYDRHLATDKHKWIHFGYILDTKNEPSSENEPDTNKFFECECGKKYKYSQGLSKHKKICKIITPSHNAENDPTDKELIMMLVKQNSEMLEVIKNGTHNTNNSHNNTNKK